VHQSQSVFGGMGGKKKKKKKRRRHSNEIHSPSLNNRSVDESSPPPENDGANDNGEIQFVLPRSQSKGSSGKLVPYMFPRQKIEHSADNEETEDIKTKPGINKDETKIDESIDDILFANGKKNHASASVKSPNLEERTNNGIDVGGDNKSKQKESLEESPRKINARSVQDAVKDKIGRRPRANSTDGELNLPRHGLCDEHIILESHKWDMLRLHNNNSLVLRNPPPPRGMVNLGNTCFLNATLQCLLYMPSFCHSITSLPASCYETNGGGSHVRGQKITMVLRNLSRMAHGIAALEKQEAPRTKAIQPKSLVKIITSCKTGSHRFRPGRQEDAHELLVHLLDAMHEGELFAAGINPQSSGWRDRLPIPRLDETTFVHRIFGGYFRSQLRCKCGYKSNTYDPFLDLALEVSKKHIHSIETAFNEFTRKEKLDADNRWKCSGCKKHVCPTKHLSVFRPPLSLCIHLKRFDFGGSEFGKGGWGGGYGHRHGKGLYMMGGGGSKINKPIQFPAQLSLPLSDNRVCEYMLTGLIVHVGNSATSGHYTAFVKKPGENKTWYHMDDSFVEDVPEKTVLRQRDVYVLFYSRKEVKLEFPQPPREPVLKNGVKHDATKSKAEHTSSNNKSTSKKLSENINSEKCSALSKNNLLPAPQDISNSQNGSSSKPPAARSLQLDSLSPVESKSSPTTSKSTTKAISPRSDSSAIKHAHEADSRSSSSDSSDSSRSDKNNLLNIKKSLEYAAKEQPAPKSAKVKTPTKPATVMKSNNVEVVLSRKKKRIWKPHEATKVNSEKGNVLLGNITVGGWNDDDDVFSSKGHNNSIRELATQAMESEERSRKREMHLDKWNAALDEGRKKKVKTKNPELESMMKSTSDSFQRMQRDNQQRSKGKAKMHRPKEQHSGGRMKSFNKMKKKSMQKSRKSI